MAVPLLYVDPTAAGLGLQMLLGGLVGGLVTVKLFWGRFFSLFRRSSDDGGEALGTSEAGEAPEEEV